ncbi:MAG TPA: dTDP-4-dehydrorhamnose reductase [Burkholderiales bacterium]|nr:dTDP-4-dehydrorhamnose reductase [Burkholderiales bacterium]
MKLLLLGKDGQVGWELGRALSPLGELVACGRREVDLTDLGALRQHVRHVRPDVVVNAAAYTAVDRAESEPDMAYRVNAEAVRVLAEEAARLGALLVHYSTDYVFSGNQDSAYVEDDETAPLSVYGASKLQGELNIRQAAARHLIFRTSWVYAARGTNFAKTILRLAREREELRIVADQHGAPTSAEFIADATALALHGLMNDRMSQWFGTYHLSASGSTSWFEYAVHLLTLAQARGMRLKVEPQEVRAISTSEYPVAAKRPAYAVLNCDKLARVFGLQLPDWRYHLSRFVDEISGNEGQ